MIVPEFLKLKPNDRKNNKVDSSILTLETAPNLLKLLLKQSLLCTIEIITLMALLAEMAFLNSRDLLQHLETKRLT